MILRNCFSSFSNNFQISIVTMKPTSFAIWRKSCNRTNNYNIVLASMKTYHGNQMPAETTLTDNKRSMTDEDRIKLQKWLEMCKFQGEEIPNNISEEQFFELFEAPSVSSKKKFLRYLVKREAAHANTLLFREKQKAFYVEQKKQRMNRPQGHIEYELYKNAMFEKSYKRHFLDIYHHRLASAMIHGQPLVIDLGFEEHMDRRETTSVAEEVGKSVCINRSNDDPFNLTLCNVDFESKLIQKCAKYMSTISSPSFPINITSKSYVELFPKNKIVYLSPNAKNEMTEYDHYAIYVIGGIFDRGKDKQLTLAKAKMENITVQKLPLDKYLIFKLSKSLSINVVAAILLDVKKDGDWKKAFNNVPKRLLFTEEEKEHTK